MSRVVLLDNRDSFVYNLVDALAGHKTTVFRNDVDVETVLSANPELIVLSPGPGHPSDAGIMMELIENTLGNIPIIGICLGFQALMQYHGGEVAPCGPVHGKSIDMELTAAGIAHPIFQGLTTDREPDKANHQGRLIPVARYHSLGSTVAPTGLRVLATTPTQRGEVVMAAETDDGRAIGLQFHPESILSPSGPLIIERCISQLIATNSKDF